MAWRGVVTNHPGPYSIEIDGRLIAPANLAKVVGKMTDQEERMLIEVAAERDALRELVAAQAMTNAELAQKVGGMGDQVEWARLQEVEADFLSLRGSVQQHFYNLFGTFTPTSMDCRAKGIDASDLIEEMARYV